MPFIGGEITLKGSHIAAPAGRINIVGIQSSGEISLIDSGLDITENITRGNISMSESFQYLRSMAVLLEKYIFREMTSI